MDLSCRLRDRAVVDGAVDAVASAAVDEYPMFWRPAGLCGGYTGLALVCGQLGRCVPHENWDRVAHMYLHAACGEGLAAQTAGFGLYDGIAGVAFAAHYLSQNGSRYGTLIEAAERTLIPGAVELSHKVRKITSGCSFSTFDVISGLSGIGLYLLCRRNSAPAAEALAEVINAIEELLLRDGPIPAWHTPKEALPSAMLEAFPNGNLNLGVAHGMPGMLTFLSLCRIAGVSSPRQEEAIEVSASWLLAHTIEDDCGMDWPTAVTLDNPQSGNTQLAWCYGSVGVSRSLWLAGTAIGKPQLQHVALSALEAVAKRMNRNHWMTNPTFCHGLAGVLQVVLRFENETGGQAAMVEPLVDALIARYEPSFRLGYQDEGPHGLRADRPGILQGMAGILLVLLAVSTHCEPEWDRMFALS